MRSLCSVVILSVGGLIVLGACGGGTSEPEPVRVATVTVTPPTATMPVGGSAQLSAAARAADGTMLGTAIAWTSSNTAVATVSANGLVTGVAAGGPVVVTATSDGQSGSANVTVTALPVVSVSVTPPTGSVAVGLTLQLTAVAMDATGAPLVGRTVTWSTSSASLATVSLSGLVTGVAPGGPVTITATSEGKTGSATVTVTPPLVATVAITPASPVIAVGGTAQLVATTRDATGAVLAGRVVAWTSSNTATATVSQSGVVTAVAAGAPAIITATSEGKSATASVNVVNVVATGIRNVETFLDRCPTLDPAYAPIRQDFELRSDGVLITGAVACTEPFSTQPIAQLTDELIALQVLRTAYYMSQGTAGKLPWTAKSLYDWMKTNIAGVNLKTAPGQLYCCDVINGKAYFSTSRQDATQRDFKRVWTGISGSLDFYAHEIRHADAGSPPHVTGCPAFPSGTFGCDATYDPANLGAYGIQYWLNANWASGYLNIGIGCASVAKANEYANWHVSSANATRNRFVSNAPPVVVVSGPPGGFCLSG